MIIKSITRPQFPSPVADLTAGEFDSTFHQAGDEEHYELVYAKGLLVRVDLYGDGMKIVQRGIRFSDHTGLEQEWGDGTSATILDSVLQTLTDNLDASQAAKDSTSPEVPNTYQRSQLLSKSYTPSLS